MCGIIGAHSPKAKVAGRCDMSERVYDLAVRGNKFTSMNSPGVHSGERRPTLTPPAEPQPDRSEWLAAQGKNWPIS